MSYPPGRWRAGAAPGVPLPTGITYQLLSSGDRGLSQRWALGDAALRSALARYGVRVTRSDIQLPVVTLGESGLL